MSWFDRSPSEIMRKFAVQAGGGKKHTVTFLRTPPSGHWVIKLDQGSLPEKLKGTYIRFEDAMTSFKLYLKTRPNPPEILAELPVE